MTSEVPSDFDTPWCLSDVILHTENSDGKDIHASKTALAMFSPYFRALFFGDLKKTDDSPVNVEGDYTAMVEILRNIHQIGYTYYGGQKQYTSELLVDMYNLADQCDFAFIRKMCVEHMLAFANIDMAKAAAELELYDILMNIIVKLTKDEVVEFLKLKKPRYYFNKKEFLTIFEKIVGQSLPRSEDPSSDLSKGLLSLEEITEDLENPRVDLTKPWPTADLAISTNNAKGRLLYANKAVIDMICPDFAEYLCTSDELLLEGPKMLFAQIDEEFTTIREILYIIHVCKTDFNTPDRVFHPALLHSMYCAADVDRLDIPMIRNLCESKLMQNESIDALDVLCCLDINSPMCKMMDSLIGTQMRDWIYRDDMHLSYRNGDKTVGITPSQMERVFYSNLTASLIGDYRKHFFPKL